MEYYAETHQLEKNTVNLAIDYDGTIADTNSEKLRWIKEKLGREDVPHWMCNHTECAPIIGEADYKAMGSYVYERESTLAASEVPGALDALRVLSESGHRLVLLTARPAKRQEYSMQWLRAHGVDHLFADALSSHGTTKSVVCEQMSAQMLIDDDPRHVRDLMVPGLRRVLLQYGRPDTPSLSDGVMFCRSWDEIVHSLIERK